MDKQNVVYTYNGMFFVYHKEERNFDPCPNMENIMLTEISQIQKDKYCDSTYMRYLRKDKFIETKGVPIMAQQ